MQCVWAILSSVDCPTVHYFSTLSHKRHDLKKVIEYKMCVLVFLTTLCVRFLNCRKNWEREVNKCIVLNENTHYLCQIGRKLEFSQQIFEIYSNIKLHKNMYGGSQVVPCGRTDGQTDMTELIVAFCNLANKPENCNRWSCLYDYLNLLKRRCIYLYQQAFTRKWWL